MKLKDKFAKEVKPSLIKELEIKNSMACPTIKKIVINSGLGKALEDPKIIDYMLEDISNVAGQKAVVTKSRQDISNFNRLKKGDAVGVFVTLRGERMWSFLDKLISIVMPGVRDFRGVSEKSFDGSGNYNMGFKEHSVFLEVDQTRLEKTKGLQVTIHTTAGNNDGGYLLLKNLGFPFRD